MKKHFLLARMLMIVIIAGLWSSSLQAPLSAAAAETDVSEAAVEEEADSGEEPEIPEDPKPIEEAEEEKPPIEETDASKPDTIEADTENTPSEDNPETSKEANEKPEEEKSITADTGTPSEISNKSDDASTEEDEKESKDEIIEEIVDEDSGIDECFGRATYNDVFATLKGSGYSLIQARNSTSTTFTVGQYMYIWGWLHDANNNLFKRYGSGTVNMTLAIYRPDGSCACKYTYNNSDNNWIGCRLDKPGTWKIQSYISGALSGNNIQNITVRPDTRGTYSGLFATLKGSGYSLSQARNSASTTFTVGQYMYIWGWLHDANGNLYKSYGSGTVNMTLEIYRPDGSCAYRHTYYNSDNNWIGCKLDKAGTWTIKSKISGAQTGTSTRTVTVKNVVPTGVKIGNAPGTMYIGDSKSITATVSPSNATNKGVTWKSSNTTVLAVSSSGKLTAKKAGTAKITVTTNANGKTASITVTVKAKSNGGKEVYNKAKSFLGKKYTYFSGKGFHYRAWCADFVSYCAKLAGQTKAIPKNASVSGIRTAIKNAGGKEYSKANVKNGSYVPKRGDIIIFKSSGASHVGIVDYASKGYIYYIDGNNTTGGKKGNSSFVNYSKCKYNYSKFTCILHPKY